MSKRACLFVVACVACRAPHAAPDAGARAGDAGTDDARDGGLSLAAPPRGAETIAPGVTSVVVTAGRGEKAARFARVRAKCDCWDRAGRALADNERLMFGVTSSDARRLDGAGRCGPALLRMSAGETRRLWIDAQRDAIATTCDATLDAVLAPPPAAPSDLKAPPPDAKRTASGIAYRLVGRRDESGSDHRSAYVVDYAAWTSDGGIFAAVDGAEVVLPRDEPLWDEGLRRMRPGDRMRFWVPADVQRASAPGGMLVYDVELRAPR